MSLILQEGSDGDGEELVQVETVTCPVEDNSNDENDVDDETMSGKHRIKIKSDVILQIFLLTSNFFSLLTYRGQ